MQRRPCTDRLQRSWIDQILGLESCPSHHFDGAGQARAVVLADWDGPSVDSASEHSHPEQGWRNPRAEAGESTGREVGRSGVGPLRAEAVGRSARISQTRAGRPPHPLIGRIYRALFLTLLGCVGFAMFWLILHLGSR